MNSPQSVSSFPTYKNIQIKHTQSPVELKEKMRKNYKNKIQNCRNILLNKFRGCIAETDLHDTLTEIYKSMFNFSNEKLVHQDETQVLGEIEAELVQEEFQWWLAEYEKSQMENIDWSLLEQEDKVICPICQKTNFSLIKGVLTCHTCVFSTNTNKTLSDIQTSIVSAIDKHNMGCYSQVQFSAVSECNDSHIYLICETCMEMQLVV